MKQRNILIGSILIIVGLLFSLESMGIINNPWGSLWPLFLVIPGIAFHLAFFLSGAKKHLAGLLVPGGILLVIGSLFIFETFTSWQFSHLTWPVYLFAVSFGLFELYFFGGREAGLLIPVFILAVVGIVFLLEGFLEFPIFNLWPFVLIVVGIYIMFGKGQSKQG
ncbi:LiaI-LiaF-like domain-containing protein [Bacillus salitolerans]|uniref:LiaI-LiaF-like domain-containing protein n=1 Tax=Bacillus salitolerans TaxID=1437434 RepID=A0ABW4LKH6_9BACI